MTASDYPKREEDGLVHLHPDPFVDALAGELLLYFDVPQVLYTQRGVSYIVNDAMAIAQSLRESFNITEKPAEQ